MTTVDTGTAEASEMIAVVSRNWWMLLFVGIVSIVVGAFCVFQPETAIKTLALLFAIWLIITGLWQFVRGFSSGLGGVTRALLLITGALSLLIGLEALRSYFETNSALLAGWILAIFIGVGFLMRGFADLFMGIERKGQAGRGWQIFSGIVIIIGGFVVLTVPMTIVALAWVVGIWLIVIGLFEVLGAFMVKRAAA
ncbi:MAG: DUF308 domain-containing protein [Actinomycetota bacterium]|nr:DUF308 domain-containing protein [Actinomycetota bacterium]